MSIIGGLDIHRNQLTFDYLDTQTGRLERGRIAPADRERLAGWLTRFDTSTSAAFALEGCTGWRYVVEEMHKAGVHPHLAEPADTAALRGPKRRAKTDKADAKHLRELLETGRLPECYIPPPQVLEWRAMLELYSDLRVEHSGWAQRVHATCFHQGTTALGQAGVVRASRVRLMRIVEEQLSPAGRLQANTALSIMDTLDEHLDRLRQRIAATARHVAGAGTHGRYLRGRTDDQPGTGVLARRRRPLLILPQGGAVRRPGHHRALLRQQAQSRPVVAARTRGAALAAVRGGQDFRPQLRPGARLLRLRAGTR